MVCYICLQHNDHNVVSSSLETHEIILKYSNLFDFDQLLISTQIGSIEEMRVSEVLKIDITYLLSLCEHGDLHLRGACASLLATLIQTTTHLLLNNVHLYQLIHKTVQGIKLLEDSIQHTRSSCILAKVSLAQFIDDIVFRILTYLEHQQLKQQYPDICVRQATASTFAKFVDHNSFLPCQWLYKIHHSLQAQASTRIQINEKDSSTTSNTDKVKKVNHTQLVLSLISTQDLSKKFGRETLNYFKSTFNVRKSLRKYINRNESDFQAAVLDLLVQLLLIRVNYS
ncbi:unnamed protein product [Rotaria sp. Silwood1]|nr:unnamed protein product [Rotaria sp. Silwood1]CAF1501181.1 unnamed protein product [Rotaria sp. Silwood1]